MHARSPSLHPRLILPPCKKCSVRPSLVPGIVLYTPGLGVGDPERVTDPPPHPAVLHPSIRLPFHVKSSSSQSRSNVASTCASPPSFAPLSCPLASPSLPSAQLRRAGTNPMKPRHRPRSLRGVSQRQKSSPESRHHGTFCSTAA
ncbi:hypothetical protein VTJ04DRAFT_3035 [Mycothermus thermophilus]|uniref:uncharacterized protein n=1 Tax=Humicola insolens TaxID=85995 RepID=UPI0037440459